MATQAQAKAEPIKFPFRDSLALRIANLITSDIESLEKLAFNMAQPTGWQNMFERPYKAHYANMISAKASNNSEALHRIHDALRPMEQRAVDYMNQENRRGRPLTQFVQGTEAYQAPERKQYERKDFTRKAQQYEVKQVPSPTAAKDAALQELMGILQTAGNKGLLNDADFSKLMREARAAGMPVDAIKELCEQARALIDVADNVQKMEGPKPEIKSYGPGPKKESKEQLEQAMRGDAESNVASMDEDRVREIAIEEIEDKTPLIAAHVAKHEISLSVPGMIAKALESIKPTLVEVRTRDGETPIAVEGAQHKQFPMLLKCVTRFPVWLPGPAGSGKTTAAKNAAKALSVPFHHHGAVDNVYQLLGFIDAGGTYHPTSFRKAYEDGGIFLWDEVDASNPAALVAFNAAIENGECSFPDRTVVKHAQCYFVAAANTYGTGATHEYVGRTKLDAATLDRFVMLDWDYDEVLETAIAGATKWTAYVQKVRQAVKDAGIKHLVTPRASIRGNDLLAQGIPAEAVINMTVRKGLSLDQWNNVKNRAPEYRG